MKYLRFQFFIVLLPIGNLFAQENRPHYFFYRPENNFGSDANFGPLSLIINGSYDVYRNGGHNKNIFETPYDKGFATVWHNVRDPISHIRTFGYSEFFNQEFFNLKWNSKNAEFVPNFADHVVGNGMEYAKLVEYLDYRGVAYPHLWSALTTTVYQLMNEVIEAGSYPPYTNVDLIADMYIYNTAGMILYSTEFGKRFFSETVPTFGWSPQPIYEPITGRLQNAGQNYVLRRGFSWTGDYSFMIYWGIYGMAGISYTMQERESMSFTFGQVVNKLKEGRARGFRKIDPNLDMAAGFFYDRNNSLLFSALFTGPGSYNAQFNLYPGVVFWGDISPAFYLGIGEWDKLVVGITFSFVPVGIGFGK
jgi:hypothetical protein